MAFEHIRFQPITCLRLHTVRVVTVVLYINYLNGKTWCIRLLFEWQLWLRKQTEQYPRTYTIWDLMYNIWADTVAPCVHCLIGYCGYVGIPFSRFRSFWYVMYTLWTGTVSTYAYYMNGYIHNSCDEFLLHPQIGCPLLPVASSHWNLNSSNLIQCVPVRP